MDRFLLIDKQEAGNIPCQVLPALLEAHSGLQGNSSVLTWGLQRKHSGNPPSEMYLEHTDVSLTGLLAVTHPCFASQA